MPCSSIATTSAQISQQLLNELLASEAAKQAFKSWILQHFPQANIMMVDNGLSVSLKDGTYINISSQGIRVSGRSGNLNEIRDKVKAFAESLAGLLVQRKIETAIKKKYQVTESSVAKNGAMVLKIRA